MRILTVRALQRRYKRGKIFKIMKADEFKSIQFCVLLRPSYRGLCASYLSKTSFGKPLLQRLH
jgi:hypothetical protein